MNSSTNERGNAHGKAKCRYSAALQKTLNNKGIKCATDSQVNGDREGLHKSQATHLHCDMQCILNSRRDMGGRKAKFRYFVTYKTAKNEGVKFCRGIHKGESLG